MQQEQETLLIELPANTDFTIHNIPFGVFHLSTEGPEKARCASRVGDFIVDLAALEKDGHLSQADFASLTHTVFDGPTLNPFMDLTRAHWKSVRATI